MAMALAEAGSGCPNLITWVGFLLASQVVERMIVIIVTANTYAKYRKRVIQSILQPVIHLITIIVL